jgi:hypothetical protein
MKVLRATSVAAFMDVAGEFLEAREAEHNLIFGICSTIQADPSQYDAPPYLAAVVHGDRVVGAAIRTPPWRLILSLMDHPGAVHRLVDDLAVDPAGRDLPGVVGPAESSGAFAEAWAREAGVRTRLARHERSFRLRSVKSPRPAPGEMVRAEPSHRKVMIDWLKAFNDEALPGGPDQDWERMADRNIAGRGRQIFFWVDRGSPASIAGVGGLTPHGIRVGPVYTPPELRGRGYASNLVAGVSQLQLDAGRDFVFLLTDLANPTANKIYQAIGYEPVNDVDAHDFG